MKEMRRKMRIIGALVIAMFIGLGAWFGMTVYSQGTVWASNAYNTRLATSKSQMGDITDRDGVALATTGSDGTRTYLENTVARRALSQTVGDTAGMSGTGVQSFYSATLLDISGSLVDRLRELFTGSEHKGSSIQLTIDAELTAYIASVFPDGYDGAVCVINYKTGEILAMVSKPDYDPVEIEKRNTENTADTAYLNRCLQGLYTPGSVMKIVTLVSALESDAAVTTQPFTCSSEWEYEGGYVNCMSGTVSHGSLTLKAAFAKSCNVTFGKLAYQLGIKNLSATAERMGFNENFKFGDFTIYNSSFPTSIGSVNDLVWSGIGQGTVLVTPLHMAMITGSVANGGIMMKPKLVKNITNSLGITEVTLASEPYRQVMSREIAGTVASYMREAVESGTATKAKISGYIVCGKTGSAETSDNKSVKTNAWYTGFIYDEDNPYAVAVVIEKGGSGGNLATELATKALKKAISCAK